MKTLESNYTDRVELIVLVPDEKLGKLNAEITEATSGKAVMTELFEVYYSILNKEVILFEE